ncbi:MAG: hypothetical protein ACRDB0_01235 [Paraclostridium sp.]
MNKKDIIVNDQKIIEVESNIKLSELLQILESNNVTDEDRIEII